MPSYFQYGERKKVSEEAALSYTCKNIKRQQFSEMSGAITGLRVAHSSGWQHSSVLELPHGSGLPFGYLLQTFVFCFSGMRVLVDHCL